MYFSEQFDDSYEEKIEHSRTLQRRQKTMVFYVRAALNLTNYIRREIKVV